MRGAFKGAHFGLDILAGNCRRSSRSRRTDQQHVVLRCVLILDLFQRGLGANGRELLSTRQVLFLAKRKLDHHSMASFARDGKISAGLFASRTSLELPRVPQVGAKVRHRIRSAGQNLESHSSQELGVEGWTVEERNLLLGDRVQVACRSLLVCFSSVEAAETVP